MEQIELPEVGQISILIDEPKAATANLLLAHGAGAGMDHSFMTDLAAAMANIDIRVIRFNFPYKERGKKMPGSPKEAVTCWQHMVNFAKDRYKEPLFISGKSYGGRMASHLIAQNEDASVQGIIYFGFPLHAPGKPSIKRAAHLPLIETPQLFLQGTNDKLADIRLIREVVPPLRNAQLVELEAADHSFKVPRSVGISYQEMIDKLATATRDFIESVSP